MIHNTTRDRLLASTIIGGAFALALGAAPAFAQDVLQDAERPAEVEQELATETEATDNEVSEVVVTGTRIRRQDYSANSPIVTVGQEALRSTGSATVETLLNDLPQFVPSVTNTSNNPSNGGQANVELRGLGTQRTLVLLDGRRIVPSNSDGSVDINIIPAAIIENIESITGGASATYGSDAIAGVLNFRLVDDFEGVEVDAQYGQTERNDGQQTNVALTLGGNFDEDRGNMVFSVGYSDRGAIFNSDRDFSAVSGPSGTSPLGSTAAFGTNPIDIRVFNTILAANGATALTIPNNANGTPNNNFTGNIGFNSDDTLFAYTERRNFRGPDTVDFQGFQPDFLYNTGALNYLFLPLERYNVFTRGSYEINDSAEVFGQFIFANYTAETQLAPTPAAGNPPSGTGFLVPTTNPFIPAQLRTLLASRPTPGAPFLLNKRFSALGGRVETTSNNIFQGLVGLRGDIDEDYAYELYATFGRTEFTNIQQGNISKSATQRLLDAADGGAALCTGGFDPFGETTLSDACAAFIGRTSKNSTFVEQRVIEGSVTGPLFTLPAGDVQFALGGTYRADTFDFIPDALLSTGDVAGFNAVQPTEGGTDVYEGFGEIAIPLLRNLPLIDELNINLGYRGSMYSTVDFVQSYKAELDYQIIEPLRLRASYQRAVRAPSIGELFAPQNQNFPSIGSPLAGGAPVKAGDPCDVRGGYRVGSGEAAGVRGLCLAQGVPAAIVDSYTFAFDQVQSLTGGNPDLEEEEADTYAVGFVFRPRFSNPLFERLSASVDYYTIEIQDAVGTIDASTQVSKCYNRDGDNPGFDPANFYCTLFSRDPQTGNILQPQETNANLATIETSGIDLQLDYGFDVEALGLDPRYGSLDFNLILTYLEEFNVTNIPGDPPDQLKGTVQASALGTAYPEYKALAGVTYRVGPATLGVRYRYIGELVNFDVPEEELESTSYYDVNGSYELNDNFELRGGVINVGDQQPRLLTSGVANTDPSTFDVLGRRFYVGLTARF